MQVTGHASEVAILNLKPASPEVQNRGISGPTKRTVQKLLDVFMKENLKKIYEIIFNTTNMCHGFVSAGDALGRERPATPMSSFLARHSGCK